MFCVLGFVEQAEREAAAIAAAAAAAVAAEVCRGLRCNYLLMDLSAQ